MTQWESQFQTALAKASFGSWSFFLTGTFYQLWHSSTRKHAPLLKTLSGLARDSDRLEHITFHMENSAVAEQQPKHDTYPNEQIQRAAQTQKCFHFTVKSLAYLLPFVCLLLNLFMSALVKGKRKPGEEEKSFLVAEADERSSQTRAHLTWEPNDFQLLQRVIGAAAIWQTSTSSMPYQSKDC